MKNIWIKEYFYIIYKANANDEQIVEAIVVNRHTGVCVAVRFVYDTVQEQEQPSHNAGFLWSGAVLQQILHFRGAARAPSPGANMKL